MLTWFLFWCFGKDTKDIILVLIFDLNYTNNNNNVADYYLQCFFGILKLEMSNSFQKFIRLLGVKFYIKWKYGF